MKDGARPSPPLLRAGKNPAPCPPNAEGHPPLAFSGFRAHCCPGQMDHLQRRKR